MNIKFIDLSLWQSQIKNNVAALRQVGEIDSFQSAIKSGLKRYPAAFIVPSKDQGKPNIRSTGYSQKIISKFSIIIAIKHVGDNTGVAARSALKPVREAIASAILNWSPDAAIYSPTEYKNGQLLAMANGVIWWQDDVETTFYLR